MWTTVVFMALILLIVIITVSYIIASIEVHNEVKKAKKEKESDNSLTGHDWRDFKNDTI